jgi:ABC-2 type transport system permease protein
MRRLVSLTRVLVKNARNPIASGRRRTLKTTAFVLLMSLAFLPLMIQIGVFSHRLLVALSASGQEGIALALGFSAMNLLVLLFGILSVLSVNYFAQDVETLLALPIRPSEILAAKFLTTLLYEYWAEAFFLVPVFIAYGIHAGFTVPFAATAILVFLLLPVIPVVMASFVVMVVMLFTDLSRNRDRFGKIAGLVLMALVLAMNYELQRQAASNTDPEKIARAVLEGGSVWTFVVNRLFPATRFAVAAVLKSGSAGGLWGLLGFASASAASAGLLLVAGERLYFKGVQGRRGGTAGIVLRETGRTIPVVGRADSAFHSAVLKDLRILFRDPVFFLNCIVINFLWPVFVLFFTFTNGGAGSGQVSGALERMRGGGTLYPILLGLGMVLTASNGICSTAVSREGKQLIAIKLLPVAYGRQLLAKAAAGALMAAIGCLLFVPVGLFVFHLSSSVLPAFFVLVPIGIAFAAFTGILIDVHFPKLHWEQSYKSVKQNMNVPVHMGLCALVAGLAVAAVHFAKPGNWGAFFGIACVFSAVDAVLFNWVMTFGARAFGRIEV